MSSMDAEIVRMIGDSILEEYGMPNTELMELPKPFRTVRSLDSLRKTKTSGRVNRETAFINKEGVLIVERKGITTLYAHRNSLAFEPAVQVGKRIPAKATFEFTQAPVWFKSHDALTGLAIIDKEYKEDSTSSSLEVTLENKSLFPIQDLDVAVVLYDTEGNAIGFSRTNIDILNANNDREVAPFTWPMNRDGKVNSIEVIPIIAPTFDR